MSKVNSKKGFTVVELVVAMSLIFIASAVAVGIIKTQNDYYRRTAQTVEATNMAENAIECFRYTDTTDGMDDFDEAFEKSFTKETLPGYLYRFEISEMKITLTFEENTITFHAEDAESGEIILERSYTK